MITVLRWIAVLPGAFLAMLIVNTINSFTVAYIFPDFFDECSKAWFGSIAFVAAPGYIAPKGKFVTSLVIGTVYCTLGALGVWFDLRAGIHEHPFWRQILWLGLSIAGSVVGCALAHVLESEKKDSL